MVDKEEVPSDKLVDMKAKEENTETESDEDLVHLKLHIDITKSSSKGIEGSKKKKDSEEG